MFLFKEVSLYNKLSLAKKTDKLTNLLLNSIAHNMYTPLNALIQLNKNLSTVIELENQTVVKLMQMMGLCLQQLVFTTHNVLEMSKIKVKKFKEAKQSVDLAESIEGIVDIFREDMSYREITYSCLLEEVFQKFDVVVDGSRLEIILYNLVSNSIKHITGG